MKQLSLLDNQAAYILRVPYHAFSQDMIVNGLTTTNISLFCDTLWDYYHTFGRSFAWRMTTNPYHIVVSEIMLQQTQTHRVAQKFEQFITMFPDFATLAQASVKDVIFAWQGLGYNRRALALHKIAQRVQTEFGGVLPQDPLILETFPGIGPNTAGSICAFAFNLPVVFIETNIRAVFLHFFFQHQTEVHDKLLLPLITQTVDRTRTREWYYALMDYGVALKKMYPNPSRKSIHHTKQSTFEGSDRQLRGAILRLLIAQPMLSLTEVVSLVASDNARIKKIVDGLVRDGFLVQAGDALFLP